MVLFAPRNVKSSTWIDKDLDVIYYELFPYIIDTIISKESYIVTSIISSHTTRPLLLL